MADLLLELLKIFSAALVVVLLLSRLRLPTIAGFIVAGTLIGPSGFGWVADRHKTEQLAEIGVVLLLFTIGLEFSLTELRRMGRVVALGGGLQVGLTTAAVALLAGVFGAAPGQAVFLGFLVALSSTAIVLKGLAERGETDAPHGKLIVGVLLFQDLCVVPMMLIAPMLAGGGEGTPALLRALGTAAVVVAGTIFSARRAIPKVLGLVAATQRRDLFILAVVLICAGIGWLTSLVGLSLALGAFLAGVVLADSQYGHQALADVLPLRDIFTSLFFVSMGMLLDAKVLLDEPGRLLLLTGAVLLGKALLVALAALVMRFPVRVALLAGVALSQVGEFSFVLADIGHGLHLVSDDELRLFFAASVFTMLVTPFALRFGPHLAAGAARLRALDRALGLRDDATTPHEPLAGHVVILGFGVGGEMLAEVLRAAHVPHAVVDINAERVRRARQRGEPVYYGDVTTAEILERVKVHHAAQVAVMLNDPDATLRTVRAARRLAPHAAIIARARYVADVPKLLAAGASEAVAQEFEASIEIIARVARATAVERAEARPALAEALHARGGSGRVLPAGVAVESVTVRDEAWIVGRSLENARLRSRTGATLVAVSRHGGTAVHPAPDDVFEAGDVLCVVGEPGQIAAARSLIANGPALST